MEDLKVGWALVGARLVAIESGGHMLLGSEERVRSEIVRFLSGSEPPDGAESTSQERAGGWGP